MYLSDWLRFASQIPGAHDIQTTYRCIYVTHRKVKICQLEPVTDDRKLYRSLYRSYLVKRWE